MTQDGVTVRTVLDTGTGGLARRVAEVLPGARFGATAGPGGELWYVINGAGSLAAGSGPAMPLSPGTGFWLPPVARYRLSAAGPAPLRMDSVVLPPGIPGQDATADRGGAAAGGEATAGSYGVPRLSLLSECPAEITGDRRFRVLFGPGNGCSAATQFVGEIPPGRAPAHSHTYDEVVLVLEGEGILHAGPARRRLAPGTCAHLPPGMLHCLENTGKDTLRVLGVFHPGGSPASKTSSPPR